MRRGPFAMIWSFVSACLVIAFIIAVLRYFNGDLGAAISWIFASIYNFIMMLVNAMLGIFPKIS